MASYGSRAHAKLHRRGNSASAAIPPLPPAPENAPSYYGHYKSSGELRPSFKHDMWDDPASSRSGPSSLKMKPYLRKLSTRDDHRIDLGKTTEENERIAGLGIMGSESSLHHQRSVQDVSFVPVNGRSRHARTTSNGSQYSTTSLQRPSAPYAHAMRQTPRPYTPPVAKSYANSFHNNDEFAAHDSADLLAPHEDYRSKIFADHHQRTGSVGSIPAHPPPLHIHSSTSFTRLNASLSSIPSSVPTAGRSRGDTLRSLETIGSPSSGRASIDKTLSFMSQKPRSQSTDELDAAASRAASIRALRAAYNEKEEAKEAKYEKEALRKAEQRARKEEKARRRNSASAGEGAGEREKQQFVGKAYSEYSATHARALPASGPSRPRVQTNGSRGSYAGGVKGTWLSFMAWLRTRLLRLGRRLNVTS